VTDWATTASLATAGGTLILAVATFGSTRSANRSARIAERMMLAQLRPLLLTSRPQDPPEKVGWQDQHLTKVPGGQGVVEQEGDVIYLAAGLRNMGSGLAILHGWHIYMDAEPQRPPTPPDDFRRTTRDLYIAPRDTGFWQGAIREPDDPDRVPLQAVITARERFTIDILYGDNEGLQRTITRLAFIPRAEFWMCTVSRHWNVDRADPR
jgi:hypothetical protein